MATMLSVRPNCSILCRDSSRTRPPPHQPDTARIGKTYNKNDTSLWSLVFTSSTRRTLSVTLQAGSRADDSAPSEMSVDNALKLLGVSEGASFDEILKAKKSIVADCKDDQETIAQVLISILLLELD